MTGIKNAGGRTGMGAVMGSKNLKAVAARAPWTSRSPTRRGARIQQAVYRSDYKRQGESNPGNPRNPFHLGATNSWGGVRCRNFQYNQELYCDEIEPEAVDEVCAETMGPYHMAGCFGCQVHCRAKYKIPTGPMPGSTMRVRNTPPREPSAANPTAGALKPF